ncbi:GTP-binding protein [Vibrio sp. 10N.286.49.C2]|uniref:GTPase family protein n=1 Tax=unclassified Vibrio TaxID=2614977 RepID=UPI000C82187D|nr:MULTISPECIES: GTPase [unclassified Vibrio]PMH34858.1 GTP-binding protein [Vibrio sp. 10N.286.49.C2]PMH51354.1 GTP-binding protein [Vibrio sp. 10N.286.49.B1]PMH78642.1 GTP-binding protein [Vibrio sp. 10N.286.48.B7]
MKKIKSFYRLLSELSGGRWGIVVMSAVLPIVIMMGFGLVLAFKYGYILELAIAILVSTLIVTLPLYVLSVSLSKPDIGKQAKQENQANQKGQAETNKEGGGAEIEDGLVKASEDWSQQERVIWNAAKKYTRECLQDDVQWRDIDTVGLDVLAFIAQRFDKKTLNFSIPEGLKLLEEVSRRYQLVVNDNIPGIEYLKISYIRAGYEAYDKYGELGQKIVKAAIWANHAKNLYYNPLKVVSDLSREQATSSMTRGVVDDMQAMSKQALLDEIAAVAIDLYSGRFSFDEEDLQVSDAYELDEQRFAPELEPIRIVMVGQTGSGKSSLVNLLKNELVAEVDALPSTDTSTTYRALVDDIDVRLVDLQGLDGKDKTEQNMLHEMIEADLVLWVLKANQSARQLDSQLNERFEQFYVEQKNVSRKKPVVVCVVNQVDNLKPIGEWQPPYALDNPTTTKATIISQALAYNQALLNADLALPLSISPEKAHFGVETLKLTLRSEISEANNVQRNRQRMEAMKRGVAVKKQLGRAIKVGRKLAPKALKVASPKLAEMTIKKVIK